MRSFIRHPSDIPIEYQADNNNGNMRQERLSNVSAGGLSFSSTREMSPGTMLTVRISTVAPGFEGRAQVVWCRPEGGGFVVGVTFTESDDLFRVRMVEQLCHIEQYKAQVLADEGRVLDGEEAAEEWIDKYAHGFPELGD
jgi:predicted RNA-binding protein with TRAM domain